MYCQYKSCFRQLHLSYANSDNHRPSSSTRSRALTRSLSFAFHCTGIWRNKRSWNSETFEFRCQVSPGAAAKLIIFMICFATCHGWTCTTWSGITDSVIITSSSHAGGPETIVNTIGHTAQCTHQTCRHCTTRCPGYTEDTQTPPRPETEGGGGSEAAVVRCRDYDRLPFRVRARTARL